MGGTRRWSVALVLGLVGIGMVMLVVVQYFAETAAPGLPNEGHEPTERGSVARLVGKLVVVMLVVTRKKKMMMMLMMLMSAQPGRQAGHFCSWPAWLDVLYLGSVHTCATRAAMLRGGGERGLARPACESSDSVPCRPCSFVVQGC